MKYNLRASVAIQVETDLPLQVAIEQLEQNSFYSIESTDDVTVIKTEWLETEGEIKED